jgi:hypothetical protein
MRNLIYPLVIFVALHALLIGVALQTYSLGL